MLGKELEPELRCREGMKFPEIVFTSPARINQCRSQDVHEPGRYEG
jgi:hypothetical protein